MSLFQVTELLFFPDNWIVGYVLIISQYLIIVPPSQRIQVS